MQPPRATRLIIRIRGVLHYLWRTVDQHGVVLDDATLRQDQLDVAQAQAANLIQPDRVPDDLHRKPIPGVRGAVRIHASSLVHLLSQV
jgi:hypothetical protein